MKTKTFNFLFIGFLTIFYSCNSGPSGIFINKSDDGYVMKTNSLTIEGGQIHAKYQAAGVRTFGGELVQINNWNYYVNTGIGKVDSDVRDCAGTLTKIDDNTYSISWADCTPQSAILKWDGRNKVTKITQMPDGTTAQADYYKINN
jgi:hypothetical protein